jgi:1-deoxy-D-xylulose-5-phosphate synthase
VAAHKIAKQGNAIRLCFVLSILERIHSHEDLAALSAEEDRALCAELREFLIEHISQTGGHLASNLGVVELTLALHKVFDLKSDRLVFDVGHQAYVHKILTGRAEQFPTLRQYGGLAGFPKPGESETDAFIAGHASNSVSVALGMARARTLEKEDYSVIALLGDGALTGGLAYEGLNDAGASGEPLIVILNDNGMSISRNVGGMAKHLARIRVKSSYYGLKKAYRHFTNVVPGGKHLYRFTHRLKQGLKTILFDSTMFEEMGFTYLGPVDGHDVKKLCYMLERARDLSCPVLLHVTSQKGKGYAPAERDPNLFHGIGPFDRATGEMKSAGGETFSATFGKAMTEFAAEDSRVCAISAAMIPGVGLSDFAKQYPERCFDVGIAEGHAVAMAGGLAKQGMLPVVAIYSTFLQRSYDMLIHDISLLQLHVVFAVDRAGLVGEDGETHQGAFDVGYLRTVPGMTVLCPSTIAELPQLLHRALFEVSGPVALRYPRGGDLPEKAEVPEPTEQPDITIVSYGVVAQNARAAAQHLAQDGIHADLIVLTQLAPLDPTPILESVRKTGRLLVAEDTAANGSIGVLLLAALSAEKITAKTQLLNLGNGLVTHGSVSTLWNTLQLDAEGIEAAAKEVCADER